MATTTLPLDYAGNDLIVKSITTGISVAGQPATGSQTFTVNPAFTAGTTVKTNKASTVLTSNAATITNYFQQFTTPSLSTAAGSSQAEVITLTGLAATDLVFMTPAGGTNTNKDYNMEAVCTTNTLTVTIYNTGPSSALNGTIIFNVWIMKA